MHVVTRNKRCTNYSKDITPREVRAMLDSNPGSSWRGFVGTVGAYYLLVSFFYGFSRDN